MKIKISDQPSGWSLSIIELSFVSVWSQVKLWDIVNWACDFNEMVLQIRICNRLHYQLSGIKYNGTAPTQNSWLCVGLLSGEKNIENLCLCHKLTWVNGIETKCNKIYSKEVN